MKLTFAPRGILQIDDARIVWRNFAGVGSKFNREGDRNFGLVIPDQEMANELIREGWNIKVKPPRDPDETPLLVLPVKVKFNDRGPNVYLNAGSRDLKLDEESVAMLDNINIAKIDLDIRPYDWEVNGKSGRTAYLQAMHVVQNVDRFADRFHRDYEEDDSSTPW